MNKKPTAVLLLSCPDKKGLVAGISQFVYSNNGNIVHSDQHTDFQKNIFIMRMEWELEGFKIPRELLRSEFSKLAGSFDMKWELKFSDIVPKMAIMVSRQAHCLYDILERKRSGEFNVEIPLIIGNHEDLKPAAESYGIPFKVFPKDHSNKRQQEKLELEELENYGVNFVVLARYMQILGADFIKEFPSRIINIHHSFLPAFAGSQPYLQAYNRGVKVIGATSHFVTEELDQGPIIEQEVTRVSHRDTVEDLARKGRDLERIVLANAVRLYLENRILVYDGKTVIFD